MVPLKKVILEPIEGRFELIEIELELSASNSNVSILSRDSRQPIITNVIWSFDIELKASAHSFKQFTSRLLKLSFSLSMHIYNSDGRHA